MDRLPAIDPKLVNEFVSVAHGNLKRVRELLDAEPGLLNAAWDWGGGGFETAIGAAAHTGGREITLLLLGRGARIDLFTAATSPPRCWAKWRSCAPSSAPRRRPAHPAARTASR